MVSHPDTDHLTGVTGFQFDPDAGPESSFLGNLDTIDLPHALYSSEPSCTELEVIGARLATVVGEALCDLGFEKLWERTDGFIARLSEKKALKEREQLASHFHD